MRSKRLWLFSLALLLVALLELMALPGCSSQEQESAEVPIEEVPIEDATETSDAVDAANKAEATDESDPAPAEDASAAEDKSSIEVVDANEAEDELALDENGTYTSKDEVAWYLYTYGHLPSNYITKDEAEDAGWKTRGLSLAQVCPGKSIGGGRFGNREKRLPTASGRVYYECDIDYNGERSRNAKRIVYSNDGLIFYTEDHYKTFERLY